MKISAKSFLWFVGIKYVAMGVAGLLALRSGSFWFLVGCGVAALFLLAIPRIAILQYGIPATCFEQDGGSGGCNLDAAEIQHAHLVITAFCVTSILGGLAGIWAVTTKDKQAGRAVWLLLVAVSVAIGLWNLSPLVLGSFGELFLASWSSALWALAYAACYYQWLRQEPNG